MIRLQAEPVRIEELVSAVRSDSAGAVATFLGTVRDHNRGRKVLYLVYEAYLEMAQSEMAAVAKQARERYEVTGVAKETPTRSLRHDRHTGYHLQAWCASISRRRKSVKLVGVDAGCKSWKSSGWE